MGKIKAVALSDLHLGDTESLLFDGDNCNIIELTASKICELAGENKEIEELILNGDIPDLSEAKKEGAYKNTKKFLKAIFDKVNIKKIVYIPGNHDHHLWVEMVEEANSGKKYKDCKMTDYSIKGKDNLFAKNCIPEDVKDRLKEVEVTYPNYLLEDDKTSFFFHHGHLIGKTLLRFVWEARTKDLEDLERRATDDIELIWWKLKGLDPIKEKAYDLFRKIGIVAEGKRRGTSFVNDGKPIADYEQASKIVWYLEDICKVKVSQNKEFHFIFGHTHHGGRILRDDRMFRINGRFISVWNTGGWIVPADIWSPDAYIFFIEEIQNTDSDQPKLQPKAIKVVAKPKSGEGEGDYEHEILTYRAEQIGK